MISDRKRILRQTLAFLLAVAMAFQFSAAAVVDAADFLGGDPADTTENTSSATMSAETENTKKTTAVQQTAPYAVGRASDDAKGIDLYLENGSFLTLLGEGLYSTSKAEKQPYGSLIYDLKTTGSLNMATALNVASGVTIQATLLEVNSTYLTLTVADNANLTLVISGACGIGRIVLGNGATLTVINTPSDDVTDSLSIGEVTGGSGSSFSVSSLAVTLTDDISAEKITLTNAALTGTTDSDIHATGSMTLNNSVMNAGENALHAITSAGDLSVLGSDTIIKAVSLGIAAGGEGEVLLEGIGTLTVENLGALSEAAKAYPIKVEMRIDSAAVQLWDYTITYQNYGASGYEVMTPAVEAPVSYRVQKATSNTVIVGYHTGEGYHAVSDYDPAVNSIPLTAVAERAKYEFRVWSLAPMAEDADVADDKTTEAWLLYDGKEWDAENSLIKNLPSPVYGYSEASITSNSGNVVLYAVYVPESVVVQLHTNTGDASDRVFAIFPAYVGAQGISLQSYLDSDDLKVQGQNAETFADAPESGNTVNIANYQVEERDGDGITDLYAVWSADHILVTFKIPEFHDGYTYQYKDAHGEWQTIPAASLEELNEKLTELIGTLDIYYGKKYGELPLLRCVNGGVGELEYEFVGWYIESASGDKIILDADTVVSAGTTTANALANGAQVIFAFFENARYTLTVPTSLGKWQFYDELGEVIAFTNNGDGTMSAYVNSDTVITMKRQDETTVSSYWRLTNLTTGTYIWPQETPSANGGSYWLSYTFTMPKASVKAVYDETVRWDTAMGDYTFGTFKINGRSTYGIRVTDRATGNVLHEFRWIMTDSATKAYFTSSVETDHQIRVDAATTLYLDGVKLAARNDIVNELYAFYNADNSGIYKGSALAEYAYAVNQNIFIDNNPDVVQSYNSTTTYTVRIELLSDSKVFAIGQKAWINNITNNWSPNYRSKVVIVGGGKTLEMYSLLVHSTASSVNNCKLNILRTGNDDIDNMVHWLHFDAGDGTISGCTVNANNRSFYTRHGGSLKSQGNGTTFSITGGSVLRDVDTIYTPFLVVTNSTVYANRITTIGYGFRFTNSTIVANIIGYMGAVHTGYANSYSYLVNCDVTVNDWMSVSRMYISKSSTLTVANGFHLYESFLIYEGSTVKVGSFGRFKTIPGNSAQDGKHYAGTDANHFFFVNIYGGSTLTVDGDMNIGVNHDSMPEINIYGAGTAVTIGGNAEIINTVRIYNGAAMTVAGDLTLHQDFEVKDSATKLSVMGNLYHVTTGTDDSAYKTVSYGDGTSEDVYWAFSFADDTDVTVGGVIGSKTEYDRTHIAYSRENAHLSSNTVIRDVQVKYTLPDGFTNAIANPDNIRLVGDIYVDFDVILQAPENTGSSPIILEQNCWYSGETNWTGWAQNQSITLYDGVLRLEARATEYLLTLLYDGGAIEKLEYLEAGGTEWITELVKSAVNIPIDATVRVTVPASYASLVCAESLVGGVYAPITLTKTPNGESYEITFAMNALQIMLVASKNLTLYLDEGNIHVKEVNSEVGFARYNGISFVPYGGNLIVTQKNTTVSCRNTLSIERNVAADAATVTMTGIVVLNKDDSVIVDTVYFAPGVTATLRLSGDNSIRNIRVPQTANATLLGDGTAHTQLMNSSYFSGVYSATDATRYYAQIGDRHSGHITMRGGKYTTRGYFNHQGSAVSIGNPSDPSSGEKPTITLDGITFISASASLNPRCFATPSGTITVTDCTLDMKTTSAAPFHCRTLEISGDSDVTFSYSGGADYAVSAFSSVSSAVVLRDNTRVEDFYSNIGNVFMANTPSQSLTLLDNASYFSHGGLLLGSLVVKNDAKLYATGAKALAIAASRIDISGGEVVCGYLVASGYVNDQASGADLATAYMNDTGIVSSGMLTISGGTVTATGGTVTVVTENDTTGIQQTVGGMIGGSRDVTVTISGGTVSASHIGESEYVLGIYRRGTNMLADAHASAATIAVSDGDLSFALLGGEHSLVTLSENVSVTMAASAAIEGAVITLTDNVVLNMGDGAVIGGAGSVITIEKNSKIQGFGGGLGEIEAENGTLTITDSASVHVSRVALAGGDITVSTTSRVLNSNYSYNTGMQLDADVGLFVDYGGSDEPTSSDAMGTHAGDLTAENVIVKAGSYVSAYRLGSNAMMPNAGILMLESGSYIYTCIYGAFSSGSITVDRRPGSVVNGKIQVSVSYDLNLGNSTEKIEDIMPADALYNYEPTSAGNEQQLMLPVPERKGYRFEGWWYQGTANMTEEYKQTYVLSSRETSTNLIAQWTPVNIWVHMTDATAGLDEWQVIEYGANDYVLPSFVVGGNSSNAYTAQGQWQTVFGSAFLQADTEKSVPRGLYDLYLSQNGIDYSDGLTDQEKMTLRLLESLEAEDDAAAQATIQFVSMKPDWMAVKYDITFNAGYADVEAFRYGNVVKPLTIVGSGRQEASYYIGATYAFGAYVGGERMPGLPTPIRKGYNFTKWVNGLVEIPWDNTDMVVDQSISTFTAEYTAKTFRIYLCPVRGTSVGAFAAGDKTGLTEEIVNDITVYYFEATFDEIVGIALPKTEILGYVHGGWEIVLKDGSAVSVDSDTIVKWDETDIELPSGYIAPSGVDGVLVLTPDSEKAEITYDMHGGDWTNNVTAELKETFKHYTNQSAEALPTVVYTKVGDVYTITNKQSATQNSVVNRGYRFLGWAVDAEYKLWEASSTAIEDYFTADKLITMSDVTYADVTYHAIWKPCEYNTVLHTWATDGEQETWEEYFSGADASISFVGGSNALVLTEGSIADLPHMDDGKLTFTPAGGSESTNRLLLGWMFDGEANPVLHYYKSDGSANQEYARRVAMAMNNKSLYQDGDVFRLPEIVEDPGDGGTIHLYAVYRERSLIFVHRTPDGGETVKLIADYDITRSGYPDITNLLTTEDKALVPVGFELSGWYVNTKTPDMGRDYTWYGLEYSAHPQHSYYSSHNDTYVYRTDGRSTFSVKYYEEKDAGYDIYVYTYYAPQIEAGFTVYAQAGKNQISSQDSYTVPDSMKVASVVGGYPILYTVEMSDFADSEVRLVDKSVFDGWTGGDAWVHNGTTYYANKTFALEMVVTTEHASWNVPLTLCSSKGSNAYITAGTKLKILVYSTNRLANTQSLGDVIVTISFPTLAHAELKLNVELNRRAAVYELVLDAQTPEFELFEDVSGWSTSDISQGGELMKRDFEFGSSSDLLPALQLMGYTFTGWQTSDAQAVHSVLNYAPAMGENTYLAETVTARWSINHYTLTPDSMVQSYKNFAFENQSGNDITSTIVAGGNGAYSVPYKTRVILSTEAGHEVDGYPEFIQGIELDANEAFVMPAENVELTFNRLKVIGTLDDVVIGDDTYRIGGDAPIVWRGDYAFSGNLANVTIQTANIPSISNVQHGFTVNGMASGRILVNNGGADLTLDVSGTNALEKITAGGSSLVLQGNNGASLELYPVSGAAISGNIVTINALDVDVNLTSAKHPSGNIVTSAGASDTLYLTNGTKLNAVCASPAATYKGTVLACGYIGVTGGSQLTAMAAAGCPVSSDACLVDHTTSQFVINASQVSSEMKIADSASLSIENGSNVVMNGSNASVTVDNILVAGDAANNGSVLIAYDAVVKGDQTIGVYADVIDRYGRHLDIKSGGVAVTDAGYTQGARVVSESRAYVLVGSDGTKDVSLNMPQNTIYLDHATIGTVTCEGNVSIRLLSDSALSGLGGASATVEITNVIYGEVPELISLGDVVAHRLAIENCELNADGFKVGSMGETVNGKVGKVILDGCTVTADTVGALGTVEESFTLVELLNSPSVDGTIVIDRYRLNYVIDSAYDTSALPTVLRSTITNSVEAYNFKVPSAPVAKNGAESYFFFWYAVDTADALNILSTSNAFDGVFSGFNVVDALTGMHIAWATAASDDSSTLDVYAWLKPRFSSIITEDRLLNAVSSGGDSAGVYTNGAWTAKFTVDGTIFDNSRYQLVLNQAFPAGTMLTLMNMTGAVPKYYYYECLGNETSIALSSFKAMGSSDGPALLLGGTGATVADVLQLSADFSSAQGATAVADVTVSLGIYVESTELGKTDALYYDLTAKPSATITVEESQMHISWDADSKKVGEKIYLTAEVTPSVLPYDAYISLGGSAGTRIGDNTWMFVLGNATASQDAWYAWAMNGFDGGDYTIRWRLSSAAADERNVFADVLAEMQKTCSATVTEPYMDVVLDTINNIFVSSRILAHGKNHTLVFTVDTNGEDIPYYVSVEKQSVLGSFSAVNGVDVVCAEDTATVTFSRRLVAGVYRICFSLDEIGANGQNELQDNVYYTFIVE